MKEKISNLLKNSSMKSVLWILLGVVYTINPFDIPGPIDDIIVDVIAFMKAASIKQLKNDVGNKVNNTLMEKSNGRVNLDKINAVVNAVPAKHADVVEGSGTPSLQEHLKTRALNSFNNAVSSGGNTMNTAPKLTNSKPN